MESHCGLITLKLCPEKLRREKIRQEMLDHEKRHQENTQRRTLRDFKLFVHSGDHAEEISIWDFAARSRTLWEPEKNKDKAQDLLWRAARTISKILHFCIHRCLVDDVKEYIPVKYAYRAFEPAEWENKLRLQHALFNSDVLKKAVETKILPRWKQCDRYPVYCKAQPATILEDDAKEKARRKAFFDERASSDGEALVEFMAPLVEPLDWRSICAQATPADKQIHKWAVDSLSSGASLISELLGDNPSMTRLAASNKRNPQWLDMGNKHNRPPHEIIPLAGLFWHKSKGLKAPPVAKRRPISSEDHPPKKRQLSPAVLNSLQLETPEILEQPDLLRNNSRAGSSSTSIPSRPRNTPHLDSANSTSEAPRVGARPERNEVSTASRAPSPQSLTNPQPPSLHPQPQPPPTKSIKDAPVDFQPNELESRSQSLPSSNAESSPNLTTRKISKWDRDELSGFLTRMNISPANAKILMHYHFPNKGRLTGNVLLSLTKEEIDDEKLEVREKEQRKKLWKVIRKLHARVWKNDRAFGGI